MLPVEENCALMGKLIKFYSGCNLGKYSIQSKEFNNDVLNYNRLPGCKGILPFTHLIRICFKGIL